MTPSLSHILPEPLLQGFFRQTDRIFRDVYFHDQSWIFKSLIAATATVIRGKVLKVAHHLKRYLANRGSGGNSHLASGALELYLITKTLCQQ